MNNNSESVVKFRSLFKTKQRWIPFIKIYARVRVPWFWIFLVSVLWGGVSANIMVRASIMLAPINMGHGDMAMLMAWMPIFILGQLIIVTQSSVDQVLTEMLTRNVQSKMWAKMCKAPMKAYGKERPSDLVGRLVHDATEAAVPIFMLTSLVTGIVTLYHGIIETREINLQLTNYMLLLLVPLSILVVLLTGRIHALITRRNADINAKLTGFLLERLGGVVAIKALGAEKKEIRRGIALIRERFLVDIQNMIAEFLMSPIELIPSLSFWVVFLFGYPLVQAGIIDFYHLALFYMIGEWAIGASIANIAFILVHGYKRPQGTLWKIAEVLDWEEEKMKRSRNFDVPPSDIALNDVSFGYTEDKKVISNMSLTIPHGKVTAIVGANGAGKTTLFNLLTRIYKPDSGKILHGDVDAEDFHLDEWRRAFSYVPQNSPLMSGTVRENICYGLEEMPDECEIIEAAKLANCYEFIAELGGFDIEVTEGGANFSGGERQRIAIARAIIKDPDYLLLDEALVNLDAKTEAAVQQGLDNLMKDRTTVIIAHTMRTITGADRIIVLDKGQVNGIGSFGELYKTNAIFKSYVDLQMTAID